MKLLERVAHKNNLGKSVTSGLPGNLGVPGEISSPVTRISFRKIILISYRFFSKILKL